MSQSPPRMAPSTEKLSQAAFGAASQAIIAHSGGSMPSLGGKPGSAQEVDLEDLFSLRRPKNVLSGASSGLQSVAKGAAALRGDARRRKARVRALCPGGCARGREAAARGACSGVHLRRLAAKSPERSAAVMPDDTR